MVSHYQPGLLAWCFITGHAYWFGISLSAKSVGVVLTIGHAFWCGASLKAMSSGVVSHYRPCLLAWYLTIGHASWSVSHFNRHFDLWSAEGIGIATSLLSLHQTCLLIHCHSQIRLLVQCNSIRHACLVQIFR